MKRISAHLVVLLTLLMLSACSPDPTSKQQKDTSDAFAIAQKKIAQVAAGYIDPTLIDGQASDSLTLRDYQRLLLQKAIDELAPLTTAGSEGQQVASALAIANAHARLARFDAEDAVRAAASYAPLGDRAIATLVTARAGQTLADANNQIKNENSLDDIRRAKTDAETQSDRQSQEIGKLTSQIKTIDDAVADLSKQRDDAMKQSADLRARAFDATGQIRFDLHTKAANLAVNADQLSGQIDLQNIERNKLDALRTIATIHKQQADSRAQAAQRAINEMGTQNQSVAKAAKLGSDTAIASAEDLLEQIKSLSKDYDANVVAQFDSARAHLEQAVKTLSAATGKDPDHSADVKLQYAVRQAELGHLLRQASVLYQGHAALLTLIAEQTQSSFPAKPGEEIRGLARTASAKADQAVADALAALKTADGYLAQAADDSRNPSAKQAALRQQELVCAAGGELGDETMADKVAKIHSQIKD